MVCYMVFTTEWAGMKIYCAQDEETGREFASNSLYTLAKFVSVSLKEGIGFINLNDFSLESVIDSDIDKKRKKEPFIRDEMIEFEREYKKALKEEQKIT